MPAGRCRRVFFRRGRELLHLVEIIPAERRQPHAFRERILKCGFPAQFDMLRAL